MLTFRILMGSPIDIDAITMVLSILCLKGSKVQVSKYDVFLFLNVVLILANSADPYEMQHYAAFHQGLYCLPKYLFRGFLYIKGKCSVALPHGV